MMEPDGSLVEAGRLLTILVGFISLVASAVSAQVIEPIDSVVVVDANGKKVGVPFSAPFGVVMRYDPTSSFVFLGLKPDGFSYFPYLAYGSDDCSGQAFLNGTVAGPFYQASTVGLPGHTLYIADTGVLPRPMILVAVGGPFGDCTIQNIYGNGALTAAISATDTFIPLTNASTFDVSGPGSPAAARIDSEWITYTGVQTAGAAMGLTGVVRGQNGTQAAEHAVAASVVSFRIAQGFPVNPTIDLDTLFTPPFHLVAGAPISAVPGCCGDCNGNGQVSIDEILTSVNAALLGCSGSH